uniref:Uncharacterized conserved protein, contains predicted SAM-dependent methyltransferase domain n=1 Tax=Candidatus Kentrum sp. MB TaxID=2138164 RepID=A0A450X682_9GAMM|nr:MAG: Uncharacterized conserved protein, contains predicted SAM-dependent methyltransferase domain [Candidatus Kentron sp. MB]VFK34815.1 MAG: Uncharacterized conserved protein, contains predicted SAM-dependent methyltransferase domain [Candidatus Kentron sp. MB]VFK74184.1 MAG: Uncharacterized conserved protein, contains predicted SAM-dependent methyltransferase domain [Candidatus Kentron sp. MB]
MQRTKPHAQEPESSVKKDTPIHSEVDQRLQKIWEKAYAARTNEDLKELYADWAKTYDDDHEAVGFFGHKIASELLVKYVDASKEANILDAGAGTGAAGIELAKLGCESLTALDLSDDMLSKAEEKGVYRHLVAADLGLPLDTFSMNQFDAAILVGVFSYGQAPAHALNEIVRIVKPGGVIVFTMRTDFYESDAMGVRSRVHELEKNHAWQPVEITEDQQYLPKKDPTAMFRVWCYRVLETKIPEPSDDFAEAVREAMTSKSRVKRLDHRHIWNSMASRLYNRYIECSDYYLPDSEEEIIDSYKSDIVGEERLFVELGCGSARKIKHLLSTALIDRQNQDAPLTYMPIDVSKGAVNSTKNDIEAFFGDRIAVDQRQGFFNEVLPTIPDDIAKVMFFFGGSLGNIETLAETVDFLKSLRDQMTVRDRFIVGMDLDKNPSVLVDAYEAGPPNHSFFLNMIRRINNELGADFDLAAFKQESTYDYNAPYKGIENRSVNLKLVNRWPQDVFITKIQLKVHLNAGEAIQVGTSRKFRREDIGRLLELSGLRLRRQWLDRKDYFSLNECVRDDAVV